MPSIQISEIIKSIITLLIILIAGFQSTLADPEPILMTPEVSLDHYTPSLEETLKDPKNLISIADQLINIGRVTGRVSFDSRNWLSVANELVKLGKQYSRARQREQSEGCFARALLLYLKRPYPFNVNSQPEKILWNLLSTTDKGSQGVLKEGVDRDQFLQVADDYSRLLYSMGRKEESAQIKQTARALIKRSIYRQPKPAQP